MKYVFDVDGTLTPSRQPIDLEFKKWFLQFVETHEVFLATGSDYFKTVEQIGEDICLKVEMVCNCNGNDIWEHGVNTYRSEWILPGDCETYLHGVLKRSGFPLRTGRHIEYRPGMANFSIVGRNATLNERQQYIAWDKKTKERENIVEEMNDLFPNISFTAGGETGIDICHHGCDKGQIMSFFIYTEKVLFIGDRLDPKGNDYPFAKKNKFGKNVHVKNWRETWDYLLTHS